MLKVLKDKVFQGTIWYTLVGLLTSGISIILLPIMTRWMDPEEFGILNAAMALSMLIMPFATIGLGNAVVRYYHEYNEDSSRFIRFFSSAFWFQVGAGVLVTLCVFVLFVSGVVDSVAGVDFVHLLPVLLIVVFNPPRDLGAQLLTSQEKHGRASVSGVIGFVIGTGLSLWLICAEDMGALGRLYGRFVGVLAVAFLLMRLPEIRLCLRRTMDLSELKIALKFGAPYIPYAFAMAGMLAADKLILQEYMNMESVGIYSAAKTVAMGMSFVFVAVTRAWYPRYFALCNEGNNRKLLIGQWTILCVLSLTVIGFVILSPVVYPLMVDAEYLGGAVLLPILAMSIYAYGLFMTQSSYITYLKKTIYLPFLAGAGAVLNLLLAIYLIPKMNMHGAAWATMSGYFLMMLLLFVISIRHDDRMVERVLLPCVSIAMSVVGVLLCSMIPAEWFVLERITLSFLVCLLFFVVWVAGRKILIKYDPVRCG